MIYIKDNFLDIDLVKYLNNDKDEFQEIKTPGKSFWIKMPSEEFMKLVCMEISSIEKNTIIKPILAFFRESKQGQDNDWRIHNDSIIEGEQPDRALVLYLSEDNHDGLNGTAFWEHKVYGDTFENLDMEEYNRLITHDANNLDLWNLKTVVGHKQNRLVSYPCKYFHCKYPNEFIESRKVFVMFYKIEK